MLKFTNIHQNEWWLIYEKLPQNVTRLYIDRVPPLKEVFLYGFTLTLIIFAVVNTLFPYFVSLFLLMIAHL